MRARVCGVPGPQAGNEGLALRASRKEAPFARLRHGAPLEAGALTIGVLEGPQDVVAVDLSASSVRLSGFADARAVDLELRSPTMLGGFLIARRVEIVRASRAGLDVVPAPSPRVELLAPGLLLHVPCAELAAGRRGDHARVPGTRTAAELVDGESIEIAATVDGPPAARLRSDAARTTALLEVRGAKKRVEIETDGATLVGFVDARLVRTRTDRDPAPSARPEVLPAASVGEKVCAHDLPLYVGSTRVGTLVAGSHVPIVATAARFTKIGAPTFDSLLSGQLADLDLEPGADLAVETDALAACAPSPN